MLNFLSSFGTDSQFEKNIIILTQLNFDAPNQKSIKNILATFSGQDQQTRAQIAFALIIKKINTSSEKENWIYLLKNLLIIDRVVSDNCFCEQLSETKLPTIQNFVDRNSKNYFIHSQNLLKKYWNLTRKLCKLKTKKKHILFYKRSQRKAFLQNLHSNQILKQIQAIEQLFQHTLQLIDIVNGISIEDQQNQRKTDSFLQKINKYSKQFYNSGLAQYLLINFYSKLLTLFSCQYLLIHQFIKIILQSTQNQQNVLISQARHFKKIIFKFKLYCNDMILLAQKNKNKKGFQQIQIKQFSTFSQQHIIKVIDEYIIQHTQQPIYFEQRKVQALITEPNLSSNINFVELKVQKKPLFYDRKTVCNKRSTRKQINNQIDNLGQNPFSNYFNTYSSDFPHKNMMTVDFILDLRKDQQNKQLNNIIIENKQLDKDFDKQFDLLKTKTKWENLVNFNKKSFNEYIFQNQFMSTTSTSQNENQTFIKRRLIKDKSLENFHTKWQRQTTVN